MLIMLRDATSPTCGGKAATLGQLFRRGLPVPEGFVVPFSVFDSATKEFGLTSMKPGTARRTLAELCLPGALCQQMETRLSELGDGPVAVRSSAAGEDTAGASAAGQHESFLAVHGLQDVLEAVRSCWASAFSDRAIAYREHHPVTHGAAAAPQMAVLIQRHLDAEVSGVMFTSLRSGEATLLEASWGLGSSVVEGAVTPDAYRIDDAGKVTPTIGEKRYRLDRSGTRLQTSVVAESKRSLPCLSGGSARRLAELGKQASQLLGSPQDIEWVIDRHQAWLVQSRPITAAPPPSIRASAAGDTAPLDSASLIGTPASPGRASGPVRVVNGPGDFARVQPGDVLVCPFTDPAWTPLLAGAAAVVTEVGGRLSHAAIVAREHRIPAVLGVPGARRKLVDCRTVTVDGTTGSITTTAQEARR